jgi:hypothetical protein
MAFLTPFTFTFASIYSFLVPLQVQINKLYRRNL